jgi:CysZ protein
VIAGFLAPFRGFDFVARRKRLWRWVAIPLLLNLVLVAAAGWAWIEIVVPWFAGLIPGGEGWLAASGRFLVKLLAYVATLPLVLGIYIVAANLVGGPFYEVLCEQVEREVMGQRFDEPGPRHLLRMFVDGIRVELGNLVVTVVGGIIAILCPLVIPGIGATVSLVIGWFLAGFGFVAYPFDRRALSLRRKLSFALRHLPATLGLGLAVSLMLIPIVTLPFAAPCAVAGAALLFPGGAARHRA